MADFSYITKAGTKAQITAGSSAEAVAMLGSIADANPHSGVEEVQKPVLQTTTSMRNTATGNSTALDQRLATGVKTDPTGAQGDVPVKDQPQNGSNTLSISRDLDNGDGTRTLTYSDGTTVKVTATKNADGTESYKEVPGSDRADTQTSPLDTQVSEITRTAKTKISEITATLDNLQATSDAASSQLIDSIKQIYGARITQMEESNKNLYNTKEQFGVRQGRARYAPMLQAGILSNEEQMGISRVTELQGNMLQLVAQANSARSANDLKMFNTKMDMLGKVDKELSDSVAALHKAAVDQQKAIDDHNTAELNAKKTALTIQLDLSERSAPALVEKLASFKTAEQQTQFIEEYSKAMGIDPAVLIGDIKTASLKDKKALADIANVENTIANRNENTAIARQKANSDSGSSADIGTNVDNIINGVSTIDDIDKSVKEKVKSRLQELGFYEDKAPAWFIQAKEAEVGQNLTAAVLTPMWTEYKNKAIGG